MAQTLEPGVSRQSPLGVADYPQSSRLRGLREFATSRRGQLAIALGLALALRILMLVRAQGMLEGDEAVLGIQAEDILRGAHPIYFYGQPYMASWEAYLLAPLLGLFGPSGTLMHVVTLAESLLLIPLLGALATKLYGRRAWLPGLLLGAVPPLYVAVDQLHFWGGYVETLVVGTGLLLVAVTIAERWAHAAPTWRLWGLVGLLIGFGCWIDPLILCYVAACALWLAPLAVAKIRSELRSRRFGRAEWLGAVWSAGLALLGGLVGAFPAVVYALQHQLRNVTYFLTSQSGGQSDYAHTHPLRVEVAKDVFSQAIPHVAGIRMVWDATDRAHKINIVVGVLIAVFTLAAVGYGVFHVARLGYAARVRWRRDVRKASLPMRAHWRYALAPLLAGVIILIFWRSSFTDAITIYPTIDVAGRYALPLDTAFVLLFVCLFANLPTLLRRAAGSHRGNVVGRFAAERLAVGRAAVESYAVGRFAIDRLIVRPFAGKHWGVGVLSTRAVWALLVLLLALYAVPYADSNMVNAFQTPYRGTVAFHARQSEILAYVEQQHIRYIWTVHWIGNVMMYLENEHVICVDYVALTVGHDRDRFPRATAAIAQADRPSFLIEADPNQGEPAVLLALDDLGVRYTWKEFGPMWIVTPTSRTVRPAEIQWALTLDY